MQVRKFTIGLCCSLMVAALVVLSGCKANDTYVPETNDPVVSTPTIGEAGVLRVGVDPGNPPLAGMESDKIVGLDVETAAAIADDLGLKLSIVDVGSDPAGALEAGRVDIVMGIDSADPQGDFWLSSTYLPTGVALFALSPDAVVPTDGQGMRFAAQMSSKSAWAVTNEFGQEDVDAVPNLGTAFEELEAGTVDYVAADAIIGSYNAHVRKLDVSIIAMMTRPSGYAIGVAQNNTELQQLIASEVSALTTGGVENVIERKWLGTSLNLSELPLTQGATSAAAAAAGAASASNSSSGNSDEGDEGTATEPGANALGGSQTRSNSNSNSDDDDE